MPDPAFATHTIFSRSTHHLLSITIPSSCDFYLSCFVYPVILVTHSRCLHAFIYSFQISLFTLECGYHIVGV